MTDKGQDIIGVFKQALSPGAKVYLNGCHSAEIAQKLSSALPGSNVCGYGSYVWGWNSFWINTMEDFTDSPVQYSQLGFIGQPFSCRSWATHGMLWIQGEQIFAEIEFCNLRWIL